MMNIDYDYQLLAFCIVVKCKKPQKYTFIRHIFCPLALKILGEWVYKMIDLGVLVATLCYFNQDFSSSIFLLLMLG